MVNNNILMNDLIIVRDFEEGNYVQVNAPLSSLSVVLGKSFINSNNHNLSRNSVYSIDYYKKIMSEFPFDNDMLYQIPGMIIPAIPNSLSEVFWNDYQKKKKKIIEKDNTSNYSALFRVYEELQESFDYEFYKEIKQCFPPETRNTIGKIFSHAVFIHKTRVLLKKFILFLFLNKMIARYLENGELVTFKDYCENNYSYFIDEIVESFHSLNFETHDYTLMLAKLFILNIDIHDGDSSSQASKTNQKAFYNHKELIIKNGPQNKFNMKKDRIQSVIESDSIILVPSSLTAKNLMKENLLEEQTFFSKSNPLHVFNTIPEITYNKFFKKKGLWMHDNLIEENDTYHNTFIYMENHFDKTELKKLHNDFSYFSMLAMSTKEQEPEFSYACSHNVFLFLATVQKKNNTSYNMLKEENKAKELLLEISHNEIFNILPPEKIEEIGNSFADNPSVNTLSLLINIVKE